MEKIISWMVVLSLILTVIFFIIVNLKIVRKLKKNPTTKNELGLSLVWGWGALTVSQALFFSKKRMTEMRSRSHGYMFANYELVHQHTSKLDKILAGIFTFFYLLSAISLLISIVLDQVGFDI